MSGDAGKATSSGRRCTGRSLQPTEPVARASPCNALGQASGVAAASYRAADASAIASDSISRPWKKQLK
jgi:hypothetical protein